MSVRADRPRLTVIRPLAVPMEPARWRPFARPLVWFGVRWLVVLVGLVLVTPRWMGFWGLVFAAYELAAIPLGWKLYRDWARDLELGDQALWGFGFTPFAPWVYAYRLVGELLRPRLH